MTTKSTKRWSPAYHARFFKKKNWLVISRTIEIRTRKSKIVATKFCTQDFNINSLRRRRILLRNLSSVFISGSDPSSVGLLRRRPFRASNRATISDDVIQGEDGGTVQVTSHLIAWVYAAKSKQRSVLCTLHSTVF